MVRNSLNFVSWKQREEVAADLRVVYTAATVDEASVALDSFALKWDPQYPQIAKSWRAHWARVIPFFAYAPKQGSGLLLLHLMFMLFLTIFTNIITKDLIPYAWRSASTLIAKLTLRIV